MPVMSDNKVSWAASRVACMYTCPAVVMTTGTLSSGVGPPPGKLLKLIKVSFSDKRPRLGGKIRERGDKCDL